MPTLSQNITNTITYLDEIRDAIINTGVGMSNNELVANYDRWINRLMPMILNVKVPATEFPDTGGTLGVLITSNCEWVIDVNAPWVTVTVLTGELNEGDATITLQTEENRDTDRTALLTIATPNNAITHSFTLTQPRSPDTLDISPETVQLSNRPGDSKPVTVLSNSYWTASVTGPFTIDKTSGVPNTGSIINVTSTQENDAAGKLTIVTDYDKLTKVVQIVQQQ